MGSEKRSSKKKDDRARRWDEIDLPPHMVKPRSKGKVWIRYIKIPLREHNEQLYRYYLNQLASKGHETGKSFETMNADIQYFYSASRPIKTQTVDGDVDITGEGGINDA